MYLPPLGGCPSLATTSVGAVIRGRLPAVLMPVCVRSGPVVRADKRGGLRRNVNEARAREWDGFSATEAGRQAMLLHLFLRDRDILKLNAELLL